MQKKSKKKETKKSSEDGVSLIVTKGNKTKKISNKELKKMMGGFVFYENCNWCKW